MTPKTKHSIGWVILSLPFVAIFLYGLFLLGAKEFLKINLGIAALFVTVYAGLTLILSERE